MKIIVTGCAGFIGSHLCEKLLSLNHNVYGIDNLNDYYNVNKKEWILWSPWELWSVYENGDTSLLNRTSEPISLVREFDSHGVLLLASKNTVSVFNPGYYITNNIISIDAIEDVRINKTLEKLYIIGTHNNMYGVFELSY